MGGNTSLTDLLDADDLKGSNDDLEIGTKSEGGKTGDKKPEQKKNASKSGEKKKATKQKPKVNEVNLEDQTGTQKVEIEDNPHFQAVAKKNVPINEDLHLEAVVISKLQKTSIFAYVEEAVAEKLTKDKKKLKAEDKDFEKSLEMFKRFYKK